MNIVKKAYCRIFQAGFRIAQPFLPYRNPEIYNSCGLISEIIEKESISSVLLVTDKGILQNRLVEPIERVLNKSKVRYTVYSDTLPNPTVQNVEAAFELYRSNRCDALIAVGGGSAIDCAKAVGARVAYPKRSLERLGGIMKVLRKIPTLIAIPTTAGTGSETTVAALITDTEFHRKYALMSFPLIPKYAVLDPELTYSLPKHLTATTGIDALAHAVEAFIGHSTTKETRRLSRSATELIFENIVTAYNEPENKNARQNMLHAAHMAGLAFSKSYVGYIHAIAHSLGGRYATPHGLENAVIMPYVLRAYGESVHKRLYELGILTGVCDSRDSYREGANKFIAAIEDLNKKLNIPDKISGIKKEDIASMAYFAEKEANPLYPVPKLMTRNELEELFYSIADWSK